MQMPCRLFYSAWHLFWRSNCSDVYCTFGAPEEIRTPDPQIHSLVFAPPARPRNPAGTGSEEIGGHVQERGRGSFHDPFCEKPAIRLSRKDWRFGASRAVVWLGSTRLHSLVPGSCPAGII